MRRPKQRSPRSDRGRDDLFDHDADWLLLLGNTFYTNDFGFTSAACAIAAGVCAQILSVNPSLTGLEVREVVAQSCHKIDLEGGSYDDRGHSPYYGFGPPRLQLERAAVLQLERRAPKVRARRRLPAEVAAAIDACLDRDPARRPTLDALDDALDGLLP